MGVTMIDPIPAHCPRCGGHCPGAEPTGEVTCLLCGETLVETPTRNPWANMLAETRRQLSVAGPDVLPRRGRPPKPRAVAPTTLSARIRRAWERGDYDNRRGHSTDWLPEQLGMLRVLVEQGTTHERIAALLTERFGVPRTTQACRQRAQQHGWCRSAQPVWTPAEEDYLAAMLSNGKSPATIQAGLERSYGVTRTFQALKTRAIKLGFSSVGWGMKIEGQRGVKGER